MVERNQKEQMEKNNERTGTPAVAVKRFVRVPFPEARIHCDLCERDAPVSQWKHPYLCCGALAMLAPPIVMMLVIVYIIIAKIFGAL